MKDKWNLMTSEERYEFISSLCTENKLSLLYILSGDLDDKKEESNPEFNHYEKRTLEEIRIKTRDLFNEFDSRKGFKDVFNK